MTVTPSTHNTTYQVSIIDTVETSMVNRNCTENVILIISFTYYHNFKYVPSTSCITLLYFTSISIQFTLQSHDNITNFGYLATKLTAVKDATSPANINKRCVNAHKRKPARAHVTSRLAPGPRLPEIHARFVIVNLKWVTQHVCCKLQTK